MASQFNFNFVPAHVREILKGNPSSNEWHSLLCQHLPKHEIITLPRVAGFLSQCAYESAYFTNLTENLYYSASRLNEVFPAYFRKAGRDARPYHNKPEMIANVVYANRMDNGNIASGDGWRYRGAGLIQLTGKYNYTMFGKSIGLSPEQAANFVKTKEGAIQSACWFWSANNLNRYCDNNNIDRLSKKINGGTHGLAERKALYSAVYKILESTPFIHNLVLKLGSQGPEVYEMQKALLIYADGQFGPMTERALKLWQEQHGLLPDGIAGPKTLKRLLDGD